MAESDQVSGSPDNTEPPSTLIGSGAGGPPAPPDPAPPSGPGVPTWWGPGGWAPPAGARRSRASRVVRSAATGWAVAGVLALTVVGLAVGLATSDSARSIVVPGGPGGAFGYRAPGPGPGPGGVFVAPSAPLRLPKVRAGLAVAGTVASLGLGTFTVTSAAGQTVTVTEQSSTAYSVGRKPASSSAVTKGAHVLVLGTRQGNSVTASRVVVLAGLP